GTSLVGSRHSSSDRLAKTRSTAVSSASSTEIVSAYDRMLTPSNCPCGSEAPAAAAGCPAPDPLASSVKALMSRSLTGPARAVKRTARADRGTARVRLSHPRGQVGRDEPGQVQVMREGGGAWVVAQGPVDLPEEHVREVDIECALAGDLKCAGTQPLAEGIAVVQVEQQRRQVECAVTG